MCDRDAMSLVSSVRLPFSDINYGLPPISRFHLLPTARLAMLARWHWIQRLHLVNRQPGTLPVTLLVATGAW